ncbi:GNAT family N-acetyltransferase [Trueperella pecoris]|uniref:GNAT family N-acetyltransferase n=1 Tax=Trueperella pecoris TaxID=2733571 RepID=A0A7M1QTD9_9ACTO|nr:GNAT family protein [Trueperella pecoris]QOR45259.1 GNAT family N-acetyltransferase [Trueperella pecoris]
MAEPTPRLRPLRISDAQDVLAAFESNPDMVHQGNIVTSERAEQFVRTLVGDPDQHPWAVDLEGRLVGLVAITVDPRHRTGWFWYWMHDDFRGRGWMSRAAATLAQWALDDAVVERLELAHRTNNPASGAVARAAGFVREGTERGKFLINGKRIDVATYGRLRSDPAPPRVRLMGSELSCLAYTDTTPAPAKEKS